MGSVLVRDRMYQTVLCIGWALCGHETPTVEDSADQQALTPAESEQMGNNNHAACQQDASEPATHPVSYNAEGQKLSATSPGASASTKPDNHVNTLSRSDRMHMGQKCKRLIDFGRRQWLSAQGFQVWSYCFLHVVAFLEKMMQSGIMSEPDRKATACKTPTHTQ